MAKTAVNPTRKENYPEWYQQVIKVADLAEASPVRGCMVIKPWGFGIWENMQKILDKKIKDTGHVNAYFPMLIPLSFFEKEAEHVEGFAKECAVVTHHRLEEKDGKLKPAGELEEPYVIRPTSETMIGHMFSKWVHSYRDLPVLMNQWCNVMRWEMRTRIFLRTSEFLWQEGHTVHATEEEAVEETIKMLNEYADFANNTMAMPVIVGEKTPDERFPGAVKTFSIEAMMQDGKALQSGTSHFLGQNFSKSSEIKFQSKNGSEEYAWTTSWGVSTRLIGGLIMTHSDDNGLILPPKLAPKHVVIIPIYRNDEERTKVLGYVDQLEKEIKSQKYNGEEIRVLVDDRDLRGGEKVWQYIKQGVPIRLEVGPRDMQKDSVFMGRRDKEIKDKKGLHKQEFIALVPKFLEEIQENIYNRAVSFRNQNIKDIDSLEEFEKFFKNKTGFVRAHWCEDAIGHKILDKYKVTPRCIPLHEPDEPGICIFTGKPSKKRIYLAKSY